MAKRLVVYGAGAIGAQLGSRPHSIEEGLHNVGEVGHSFETEHAGRPFKRVCRAEYLLEERRVRRLLLQLYKVLPQ